MKSAGRHAPGILVGVIAGLMLLGVAAAARVDLRLFPAHDVQGRTRATLADLERALTHYQSDNAAPCPPSTPLWLAATLTCPRPA